MLYKRLGGVFLVIRVGTRLSDDLNDWFDNQSEKTGISKSSLIAIACENYRKEQELVINIPKMMQMKDFFEKQGFKF